MSRIAGLMRFESPLSGLEACVSEMLATLPGTTTKLSSAAGAALGWTGRLSGGAGRCHAEGGVVVVIDGRILNTGELTDHEEACLEDAALVARLYRRHGFTQALARLGGDFAVALYDVTRRTLWLGRDRFGVKPLYYTAVDGGCAFASQPRALLWLPEVSREINRSFVARFAGSHYRTFDNRPDESPFASIAQLPAAHAVAVTAQKSRDPVAFWRLDESEEWEEPEDVLAERYRELVMRAVERRLRVATRPAFTLSGGLDSSTVLSCAAALNGERCHAVSSLYTDATYDERNEILDVVATKVARWEPVELSNDVDLYGMVARMVRIHDEPVATATWLSHLFVCDCVASVGFGSLFGGLGGDELNAGEYEYFPLFFADLKAAGDGARFEREVAAWVRHHDHPIFRKSRTMAEDLIARLADPAVPGRCLPDRARMLRYASAVRAEFFDLRSFEPLMDSPFRSYLKNRTYQDMFRETLPCCLRAEDRQCTALGLDHYDPFLDHEVVEFMFRVSGTLKIRDGITKWLLRRAMRGVLPDRTRERVKKTGWNAPAHRWFMGESLDAVRDIVASRSFREWGIYDLEIVQRIIEDHVRIVRSDTLEESHMMFLWQLLNLHLWLEDVAEQPRAAA